MSRIPAASRNPVAFKVARLLPCRLIGLSWDATRKYPPGSLSNGNADILFESDGNSGGRTLDSATFTNTTGMTQEACISFCIQQDFVYAGVEFAQECCKSYRFFGVQSPV